jgi:hypothetical protein
MLSFIRYTPEPGSGYFSFYGEIPKSGPRRTPRYFGASPVLHGRKGIPQSLTPAGYHYTPEDVSLMGKILDEYIDDLISAEGDPAAISECVRDTVLKINALNEECGRYLIDTWRRERLCRFINSAAETAGLVTGKRPYPAAQDVVKAVGKWRYKVRISGLKLK